MWPFSRHPSCCERHPLLRQARRKSVFIGRFFGPVRAVIPLAAGVMRMPRGWFWFANFTRLVWAPMLLFVGDAIGDVGDRLIGATNTSCWCSAG